MSDHATMTDRDLKAGLREILHGLKGEERKAAKWWATCLHRAGLPYWYRSQRCISARQITDLRERLVDDPELLDVFEDAYREGSLELMGRLGKYFVPDPLPRSWPQPPVA